jgi:predicted nucleic acid-binding protein
VRYLLDVSTLVALLMDDHEHNAKATSWAEGKALAVCPLTELGFIRVAIAGYHSTLEQARKVLDAFYRNDQPLFVPADLPALEGEPSPSYRKITDWYIANLAAKHGMKWATLDAGAKHAAAELI